MLNDCPIRFSLSSSSPTPNQVGMAQRMSDMLQLVVIVPYTQLGKN